MHKTILRVAPESLPVSISEIQSHLKVTGDDDYLYSLLRTATSKVEKYLNRALITQEYSLFLDCWEYEIKIPFPPLVTVDAVNYYDLNGDLQLLNESDYYWVVTSDDPGRIVRKYDTTYPELEEGRPDSIEIEFTCGYGEASDVPDEIKHAIKLICTDLHEHRGEVQVGTVGKIPNYVLDLIHPYRVYQF